MSSASASPEPHSPRFLRRLALLAALIVILTTGYFHGGGASNQNARLDAVYSFVEPGTRDFLSFRIDGFMVSKTKNINTLDWAEHDGHYYANKAPGTIWLGIPVYGVVHGVEMVLGIDRDHPNVVIGSAYLINFAISVVPLGLLAAALVHLLAALGVAPRRAFIFSVGGCLGTLLFPYSTQIWGHPTAAALSFMALALAHRGTPESVAGAGLLAGLATTTDYLNFVPTLAVLIYLAVTKRHLLGHYVLGGLLPAIALLAYQNACFGGPFTTAAQASQAQFIEKDRALGMFGALDLRALWHVTFGLRRGLFVQCPVLLLPLWGLGRWFRRDHRDPLLWVCVAVPSLLLLANATFNGWHGGATVGARYLISGLPFLLVALKELPSSRFAQGAFMALGAVSFVNMLAIAAVNPLAPDEHKNPLYGYTYPQLLKGHLSPYAFPLRTVELHPAWAGSRQWAMFNWGQLLGLKGVTSLLPLGVLLSGLGVLARRAILAETTQLSRAGTDTPEPESEHAGRS